MYVFLFYFHDADTPAVCHGMELHEFNKAKHGRREKKRVSEVERERGQVQQMKLEPMAFSGEPASGELQYKELSKRETPIVGEEVEAISLEEDIQKVRTWLYSAAKFIRDNAEDESEIMLSDKLDDMLNKGKIQLDDVRKRYETFRHTGHSDDTCGFFDPFLNTETNVPRNIIVIDVKNALEHGYAEFIDTVAHEAWHAVQNDLKMIGVNGSNRLILEPSAQKVERDAGYMGGIMYNKYALQNGLQLKKLR